MSVGYPRAWVSSELLCEAGSGHLQTIANVSEQLFIISVTDSRFQYWTGLTDFVVNATWDWVTGEPSTFVSWGALEPSTTVGYDCVRVGNDNTKDKWYATNCADMVTPLCEFVRRPTPLPPFSTPLPPLSTPINNVPSIIQTPTTTTPPPLTAPTPRIPSVTPPVTRVTPTPQPPLQAQVNQGVCIL